jgi:UDP-glucose 4-epimerase
MRRSTGNTTVVTGASSFVGAHLAIGFARAGHHVTGTMTRALTAYDPCRRARLDAARSAGAELARLDLTDTQGVADFVRARRPAVWIHHAGWATNYAGLNYDLDRGQAVNVAPLETIYPLLQECRCRGVVVTGSSAEYGETRFPCAEQDACWPTTPYGLSKLSETIRARQLGIEHGLTTRVARVFVPYGAMDAPGKLLASAARCLRSGQPIALSPCRQSRDFLHVRDLVQGYLALVEDLRRDEPFDIFNLCRGQATPLREVLLYLAELLRADAGLLRFGACGMRPGEPLVSYGANDKALRRLNWRPRPLHEGLRAYVREMDDLDYPCVEAGHPARAC